MKEILGSAIIAALITALFTYISHYKDNKLQRITDDRKAWRDSIREIATLINSSEKSNISTALVKLKVRINAYGEIHNKQYLQDGHIWRLIGELEKKDENFEKNKERLIVYLSFLLKYDWERSKKEVTGNKSAVVSLVCCIFSTLLFSLSYYKIYMESKGTFEIFYNIVLFLCLVVAITIIPYAYNIIDNFISGKTFSYLMMKMVIIVIIIVISILLGKNFYLAYNQVVRFGTDVGFYISSLVIFPLLFSNLQIVQGFLQDISYWLKIKKIENNKGKRQFFKGIHNLLNRRKAKN